MEKLENRANEAKGIASTECVYYLCTKNDAT